MVSRQRYVHRSTFAETNGFDEVLYEALRQCPWWMISITVHVLLFVLSGLMPTSPTVVVAPTVAIIQTDGDAVDAPDAEAQPDIEEVEVTKSTDVDAREPITADHVVLDDKPQDDVDLPNDEPYGNTDGDRTGDFDGISTNTLIGPGGGWARGGHGLGSNRNVGRAKRRTTVTQDSVEHALRWLATHQSPDGRWESEGFGRWCDGKPNPDPAIDGAGKAQYDVGVTGLALLAFLGAGYSHRDGPFQAVVGNGLKWLRNQQDPEGCIGARATGHHVYGHAIAALAMVEAYALTGSTMLKNPAQKSLDYIALTRNPYFAWRYGVKPGDNDTSVTGWMMMALKSAKLVNAADVARNRAPSLEIDEDAFDGIRAWIDKMTDPESGRVGYQQRGSGPARSTDLVDRFPAEKSEAMTAVGVLARVFFGENPKSSVAIQNGAKLCAALPPVWKPAEGAVDMYYWYYATLAMYQVGGDPWKRWDAAMKPAMVDSQRMDGDYCRYKGSWDAVDPWGQDGGRVYATAVMAMCLEVYYRYERVPGLDAGGR